VRTWVVAVGLCLFLFIIPLQCFIIGDYMGMGVQGAVFRYQITTLGISFIPLPYEIGYIARGIYTGDTAVSAILWAAGTLLLTCITIFSLILWNRICRTDLRILVIGVICTCILYLVSCVVQYGPAFSGSAGISLPCGIVILAIFALYLYTFPDMLFEKNSH